MFVSKQINAILHKQKGNGSLFKKTTKMDNINNIADYKKTVKIYRSHKLANGFISVNYAHILGNNCISTPSTIKIEKIGTLYESLAFHHGLRF